MEVDINIQDKAHYTMSSVDQLAKTLKAPRETVEEAFRRFPLKDGATKDQIHAVNRQRKNYIQMHKPVEEAPGDPAPKPLESVENPDDNTWTVVKKKVRVKKHKSDEQLEAETQAYINNPLEILYDSDGNEHNGHLNDIGSRF
jgi:hypothetical protein